MQQAGVLWCSSQELVSPFPFTCLWRSMWCICGLGLHPRIWTWGLFISLDDWLMLMRENWKKIGLWDMQRSNISGIKYIYLVSFLYLTLLFLKTLIHLPFFQSWFRWACVSTWVCVEPGVHRNRVHEVERNREFCGEAVLSFEKLQEMCLPSGIDDLQPGVLIYALHLKDLNTECKYF